MDQPDGFNDERNTTKKCLLQKALYGTKQAARQWNNKRNEHLESQGFQKTATDLRALLRRSSTEYSIIVIYVDDVILFCKSKKQIEDIKNKQSVFSIKDLRNLKYFLGIKIHRKCIENLAMMNQQAYIRRLAEKIGL